MATQLLMPKATAVWLVDNTALTFEQIAVLCRLHILEVKAIADGEAAQNIKGLDPINSGQLSREEIAKAEADPNYHLKINEPKVSPTKQKKKRHVYTPLSKRHDRPNAILWLVRNYPELKDAQIIRLIGTTKSTIEKIRNRTHWNTTNLTAVDPVMLGLCSQTDFDQEVAAARKNGNQSGPGNETLLPASFTENLDIDDAPTTDNEYENDDAFSKLQSLKSEMD